jgi:hypothetical protein
LCKLNLRGLWCELKRCKISNNSGVGTRWYMMTITIGKTLGYITKYHTKVDSIYIYFDRLRVIITSLTSLATSFLVSDLHFSGFSGSNFLKRFFSLTLLRGTRGKQNRNKVIQYFKQLRHYQENTCLHWCLKYTKYIECILIEVFFNKVFPTTVLPKFMVIIEVLNHNIVLFDNLTPHFPSEKR